MFCLVKLLFSKCLNVEDNQVYKNSFNGRSRMIDVMNKPGNWHE